jgi:hypothetical protein
MMGDFGFWIDDFGLEDDGAGCGFNPCTHVRFLPLNPKSPIQNPK